MKKSLTILLVFLLPILVCFAQARGELPEQKRFVASTGWVSSIAQLAGLDDVFTIAPSNMKHPPEYEITPEDIAVVSDAQLFMHAGYERMMKTIADASEIDSDRVVKVKTTNTLDNLKSMVSMLSEKAQTQDIAEKRFAEYEKLILDTRKRIGESENGNVAVYANVNQAEFAEDIGLNVVATFGPDYLTAGQIADAAEKKYVLVLDNIHNPVATPVKEVSPATIILTFRNFPEKMEENALYNIVKDNIDMLWKTGVFD